MSIQRCPSSSPPPAQWPDLPASSARDSSAIHSLGSRTPAWPRASQCEQLSQPQANAWRIRESPLSVSSARSNCLRSQLGSQAPTGLFSFPFRVCNFQPLSERVIRLPSIRASPARDVVDAYIFLFSGSRGQNMLVVASPGCAPAHTHPRRAPCTSTSNRLDQSVGAGRLPPPGAG